MDQGQDYVYRHRKDNTNSAREHYARHSGENSRETRLSEVPKISLNKEARRNADYQKNPMRRGPRRLFLQR